MKELYIIRHGETEFNKRGIVQGRGVNSDLNEFGKKQARSFYEAYKHLAFDCIYTSTLKRTHQTVELFLDNGASWEQHAGLDELDWGIYEGKANSEHTRREFTDLVQHWCSGKLHIKFPEGESPLDVHERQMKVMEHILSRKHESRVLICMHGRAMRLFLCTLLNKDLTLMETFPHQNLSLYRLHYDGEEFRMLDFNNTDHLSEDNQ